jgi:hypothetical protein
LFLYTYNTKNGSISTENGKTDTIARISVLTIVRTLCIRFRSDVSKQKYTGFVSSPMMTQLRGSSLPVKNRSYVVLDDMRKAEAEKYTKSPESFYTQMDILENLARDWCVSGSMGNKIPSRSGACKEENWRSISWLK